MYIEFKDGKKLLIRDDCISSISLNGNNTILMIWTTNEIFEISSKNLNSETWNYLIKQLFNIN